MIDRAQLHNELEQLGAAAKAAHDQTWQGAVSEPYAPEVQAAHDALHARIVAAGYTSAHARMAVDTWIVMDRSRWWSVLDCLDRTTETGMVEPTVGDDR